MDFFSSLTTNANHLPDYSCLIVTCLISPLITRWQRIGISPIFDKRSVFKRLPVPISLKPLWLYVKVLNQPLPLKRNEPTCLPFFFVCDKARRFENKRSHSYCIVFE